MKCKTAQIAEIFSVTPTTVNNWRVNGLPTQKEKGSYMFDVLETAIWHGSNIPNSQLKGLGIESDELSVDDQLKMKRMAKLDLEMAIQRGEYVSIDELDDTTTQMVALLVNQYHRHMRVLPKLLARKTETVVKKALDKTFGESVKDLKNTFENMEMQND